MALWWLCISSSGENRKFDFLNQIWPLRSKSTLPPTIEILTKVFSTPSPNLVALAWTAGWGVIARTKLVTVWRADGRTDGRRRRQYPEAKTGLGKKNIFSVFYPSLFYHISSDMRPWLRNCMASRFSRKNTYPYRLQLRHWWPINSCTLTLEKLLAYLCQILG